jgi:hypothetical protein
MKPLVFLLLIITSLPVSQTYGDDKQQETLNKYEVLISEYLSFDENTQRMENPSINQVVIADSNGNIYRQAEIKGDIELSTPDLLKPLINKAVFLTKINGFYYYLIDKN